MSLVWPILAHLSAEPLVGLKPLLGADPGLFFQSFSRTPRGFEAVTASGTAISVDSFQPNPSWV